MELLSGQKLAATADIGDLISYTITGEERQGATSVSTILSQGYLDKVKKDIYMVPSGKNTKVDTLTFFNHHTQSISVKVFALKTDTYHRISTLSIPSSGYAILNSIGWTVYNSLGLRLSQGGDSNNYFP